MSRYDIHSFRAFLIDNKENRLLLGIAAAMIITEFITFKLLYPFPSFINNDSYSYLEGAYYNLPINIYPIGYSKFLRLFSTLTNSDTALVAFQYLMIQVTALWLVLTLSYIFELNNISKYIMTGFVVLNPAHLYLSNFVSSDAFFLALSICWFTLLIWYIIRPSLFLILMQSLTLAIVFTVRYNSLYFPFISLFALFISKENTRNKVLAAALILFPIILFEQHTSIEYKKLIGIKEFNPFGGWQMANNALDAYRYVEARNRIPCPANLNALNSTVCQFFDKLSQMGSTAPDIPLNSTAYMWTRGLPLQAFMTKTLATGSSEKYFKQWASMGPLYSEYGRFIVLHYPAAYLKFYLWPNITRFYAPPVWHLEKYNMGCDSVLPIARNWFNYDNNKVYTAFDDYQVNILDFYPVMAAILNTLFLYGFLISLTSRSFSTFPSALKINLLMAVLWLANFAFSVVASPIQLRYQLFNILLSALFGILLLERQLKTR